MILNTHTHTHTHILCFPGCSVVKNLPANAEHPGDAGLTHELGRAPGIEIAIHSSTVA